MRTNRLVRILKFLPFLVVGVVVFGFVVMALWNALMPTLFGVKPIGFWQALGVFVLSKILFGGFGGGGRRGGHAGRRMTRRWARMTPEERERFREGIRARYGCGPAEPPAAGPAS
jgi:hypothetical protein